MNSQFLKSPEFSDPNSPYYLGAPSPFAEIDSLVYGRNNGISTNYFGQDGKYYLATPQTDTVTLHNNLAAKNNRSNFWTITSILAGAGTLLFAWKNPRAALSTVKGLGKGIAGAVALTTVGLGKALKWLATPGKLH